MWDTSTLFSFLLASWYWWKYVLIDVRVFLVSNMCFLEKAQSLYFSCVFYAIWHHITLFCQHYSTGGLVTTPSFAIFHIVLYENFIYIWYTYMNNERYNTGYCILYPHILCTYYLWCKQNGIATTGNVYGLPSDWKQWSICNICAGFWHMCTKVVPFMLYQHHLDSFNHVIAFNHLWHKSVAH